MAEYFTVTDVQYWTTTDEETGEEVEIKDSFGNYKLSVTFEGHGEAVDMTAKIPPKLHEKEWGHIESYQTKAGKTRHRFKRDKKDDFASPAYTKAVNTRVETTEKSPGYEAGTNARWALKLSVDTFKQVLGRVPEEDFDYKIILEFAEWLLSSFEKLAYGKQETAQKPSSGYEKFKAARPKPKELSSDEANEFLGDMEEEEA